MHSIETQNSETFWTAITTRDRSFDGQFFFGVLSTGVYCRPSCACRLPLRQNVHFFKTVAAAETAGLRPCKRCRPSEADKLLALAGYLRQHADETWQLADLASRVGLSPFHFQRRFKAVLGVTPRQFIEATRVDHFKETLRLDSSVTDAIYESGFGSSSRIYEKVDSHLGMTPAQYRAGGSQVTISFASAESPLGRLMIGATDRGICFLQFGVNEAELLNTLAAEYPRATLKPMPASSEPQFLSWMEQLDSHLKGQQPALDLPLDLRATAFQMKVWRYLQSIPYGHVESYAEVAADLGQPTAVRAVARACASNKVALLIPCHRVVRGNGHLAGYKWGIERKRTLLDQERRSRLRP